MPFTLSLKIVRLLFLLSILCFSNSFIIKPPFLPINLIYSKKSTHIVAYSELREEVAIERMKMPALRKYLKLLGGTPGLLRKNELIQECKRYSSIADGIGQSREKESAKKSQVNDSSSSINLNKILDAKHAAPASRVRKTKRMAMAPIRESTENKANIDIDKDIDLGKNRRGSFPDITDALATDASIIDSSGNPENSNSSSNSSYGFKRVTRFPTGPHRNDRLEKFGLGCSDMDISFLGTASCIPSVTRGVSCTALRYVSDVWLFDCGESSQVQIQRGRVKPSKVKKIFITHLHGDHSFGLAGMLCLIGQATQEENRNKQPKEVIDIYGPEGTRAYVRSVVQLSYSRIVAPHRIHELKEVPYLHLRHMRPPVPQVKTRYDPNFGERPDCKDIYPDEDGVWNLFDDEGELSVQAAAMRHTIPCVGYVVTEKSRAGMLLPEKVMPFVEDNKVELAALPELKGSYKKIFSKLKEMNPGDTFTFPKGQVVHADDIVQPRRNGRKVVILGDTCSTEKIEQISMGADIVVHEATNAWLREYDETRYSTAAKLERDTFNHGHSTPEMAGQFAAKVGAGRLVLTHFSARYGGDDSEYSCKVMWRIEDIARAAASGQLQGPNDVLAAWDQMSIAVPIVSAVGSAPYVAPKDHVMEKE